MNVNSLTAALRALPPEIQADAARDVLDAVAVLAGAKPLALLGCGYAAPPEFLADIAALPGVRSVRAPLWRITGTGDDLPGWYVEALDAARRRVSSPFVAATTPDIPDELGVEEEARLLGYPLCCTRAFYVRRAQYDSLYVAALARQADGDVARMTRLAAAQIVLAPRDAAEAARFAAATRAVFAPLTSIAMCAPCERDPDSEARAISRRYAAMAAAQGLDDAAALAAR